MSPSVLIVDDESAIVTSLEFLMGNAGFETAVARDGEQALAHTKARYKRPIIAECDWPARRSEGLSAASPYEVQSAVG